MRPPSSVLRATAVVSWLGLAAIALLAPPIRPDITQWILDLSTGFFLGEEATAVALFYLMAVWPLVIAGLLRDELGARPVAAWPFVLASAAVGSFAVLPWLAITGDAGGSAPAGHVIGGRLWGIGIAMLGSSLLVLGGYHGDIIGGLASVRSEGFMHIMAADFVALWGASIALTRRRDPGNGWLWSLVPVAGVGVWMALRRRQ